MMSWRFLTCALAASDVASGDLSLPGKVNK